VLHIPLILGKQTRRYESRHRGRNRHVLTGTVFWFLVTMKRPPFIVKLKLRRWRWEMSCMGVLGLKGSSIFLHRNLTYHLTTTTCLTVRYGRCGVWSPGGSDTRWPYHLWCIMLYRSLYSQFALHPSLRAYPFFFHTQTQKAAAHEVRFQRNKWM
jgi:hypothetical protein